MQRAGATGDPGRFKKIHAPQGIAGVVLGWPSSQAPCGVIRNVGRLCTASATAVVVVGQVNNSRRLPVDDAGRCHSATRCAAGRAPRRSRPELITKSNSLAPGAPAHLPIQR